MSTKTKELNYKGCKNVLNRVAYKLIKQNKKYKHSDSIVINGKKKSAKEIIAQIKKDGTNYGYDEFKSRFMEDVVNKTDKTILPGYVIGASGKTKYNRASYRNIVKVLTEYRKTNGGKNPSKIKVTYEPYKAPYKKYGHATKHGCDNMGQNNGHNCGPHGLQEVIRNLTGKVIPQKTIAAVCGTTSDGTDHQGLATFVAWFNKKFGFNLKVEWKNFSELGWAGIKKIVDSKNKDCIIHNAYRRTSDFGGYGHYETVNKVYNTYCDVQNSLGDTCANGCYCGYVEERDLSTFKYYINGISQKSVMVITNES